MITSKIALIAALALGMASPAFAQSFNQEDGTGNALAFAYGPGATKSASAVDARQNEQLAVQQVGTERIASRHNSRARTAVASTRGLYAYAAIAAPAQVDRNAESPALTGGGSTGYNQLLQSY